MLKLSESEREELKIQHKKERDKRICDRIKAVLLFDEGWNYRMARRSATECAGIFDVCIRLKLIEEKRHTQGRELIVRIVAMLTKMAKTHS